jgi:hypothetical protein
MNTIPPEELFLEAVECPDELLCLTGFELGQLYEQIWGDD